MSQMRDVISEPRHESEKFLSVVLLRRDVSFSPLKWARRFNVDTER